MTEQTWKVIKDLHSSMVIDLKKKTIRCAPNAWFKLETTTRIFIFSLGNETKKNLDPKINDSKRGLK